MAEHPVLRRRVERLARAAEAELLGDIIPFWLGLRDRARGGFFGAASSRGRTLSLAPKAAVLQSRILWFFSTSYRLLGEPTMLDAAMAAYGFIRERMFDRNEGGVFWTVSPEGAPLDTTKHLYAQGFAIMGLAAYHRASGDAGALTEAEALWTLVAERAADPTRPGYLEAFGRDWTFAPNELMGRSDAPKTFNAHLHLVEAMAELMAARPRRALARQGEALLRLLISRALDPRRQTFWQFFDRDWRPLDDSRSFGHDLEACWLLPRSVQAFAPELAPQVRAALAGVIECTLAEGLDDEGAVIAGHDSAGALDRGRVWWAQAEALVAFIDAGEQSGEPRFLDAAERLWAFIERSVIDPESGEWRWRVEAGGARSPAMPKANAWKCPYHNGRACLELMERARRRRSAV